MLKILILIETMHAGGAAQCVLSMLEELKDQVDFVVASFSRKGRYPIGFVDRVKSIGLETHLFTERYRYDVQAVVQMRALVNEFQPDLIEIHNTKSRLYCMLLRRFGWIRDIPQVCVFHGETWIDTKQLVYNHLDRQLIKRSRHIVVVCDSQKRLMVKWGVQPDRITVIHNAISVRPVQPKLTSATTTLLSVGRLSREKGHMLLVQAVHDLVAHAERAFKLIIVGDGPERRRIQRYVRKHRLDRWVSLEGAQTNVGAYYRQADLFVLPSYTEGFPMVLLEAALHDCPMLAFAVGGIPEAFTGGKEIVLVKNPSRKGLVAALHDFLRAPEQLTALAVRARSRVERDYCIENKARKLTEYYRTIVE